MKIPRVRGSRIFRGKTFAAMLRQCGIEPRQYWLLVDLFGTLSERREMAYMGSNDDAMNRLIALFCFMATVLSLGLVGVGVSPGMFCLFLIAFTVFQLSLVLLPEVAENLVNPVEGMVLAHQPVNGATWAGAKLTHLFKLVLYVVAGINTLPAIIGGFLDHQSAFLAVTYPARHFLAVLGAGLVVALLCCRFFGWLVRFIPARRLKRAAVAAQVIPTLFILLPHFRDELGAAYAVVKDLFGSSEWWVMSILETLPGGYAPVLGIAIAAVTIPAITFGLKSLSSDHLIRVSTLVQSGTGHRKVKKRRSVIARWSARIAGGQAGRAGFEYLGTMMRRDWQFKVNMAGIAPLMVFPVVLSALKGESILSSPFSAGFALSHLLPHALGVTIVMAGSVLSFGNDYKGAWWFLVVPGTSVPLFARGVHARLFLLLVIAPNLALLVASLWRFGIWEAALFVAFSTVIASLYLAVGLHLVTGVPFGKQRDPSRRAVSLVGMMIFSAAVSIAIGIQYLLFLSVVAVAVAALVGTVCAYFLTRRAIDNLASRIRIHLQLLALGPKGQSAGPFFDISD